MVDHQRGGVGAVAEHREPWRVVGAAVERVAVNHQEPPALLGDMRGFAHQAHSAKVHVDIVAQRFVMVAGNVDDLGSFTRLAEQLLNDVVVALIPIDRLAQPPAVDDVADQVQVLGFGMAEKIEQELGLAAARAEVDIGDPDRAVLSGRDAAALEAVRLQCLGHGSLTRSLRFWCEPYGSYIRYFRVQK